MSSRPPPPPPPPPSTYRHRQPRNPTSTSTGHDLFESGNTLGSIRLRTVNGTVSSRSSSSSSDYKDGVFTLLCAVPLTCAALQLAAWSRYKLKGGALLRVKRARQRHYSLENV